MLKSAVQTVTDALVRTRIPRYPEPGGGGYYRAPDGGNVKIPDGGTAKSAGNGVAAPSGSETSLKRERIESAENGKLTRLVAGYKKKALRLGEQAEDAAKFFAEAKMKNVDKIIRQGMLNSSMAEDMEETAAKEYLERMNEIYRRAELLDEGYEVAVAEAKTRRRNALLVFDIRAAMAEEKRLIDLGDRRTGKKKTAGK